MCSNGYWSTGGNRSTGDYSTGYRSTGDYSTGHRSTGYRSTGDYSTGNRSTGHRSTGDYSTGDYSTGYRSTGHRSTGDYSTGNYSTGDYSTGYRSTGHRSTGDYSTGDYSTGYRSTGHRSTGDYSTGNYSTGHRSTGDYSTGNWSTSKYSTGHFSTINYSGFGAFNKPCTVQEWNKAVMPNFLYFELTKWIESEKMTDKEKEENPSHKTTGGYLKVYEYKEAWKIAYYKASDEEIKLLKALPNFDAEVFKEISGIDINERDSIKVTANGKEVYISKDSAKALGLL